MRQLLSAMLLATAVAGASQVWSTSVEAQEVSRERPKIKFTRLAEKLPPGTEWATLQEGMFCRTRQKIKSDGALKPVDMQIYEPIFTREFARLGYGTSEDKTNLFATSDVSGADYQIGGLVHKIDLQVCFQSITPTMLNLLVPGVGIGQGSKGTAAIDIEWQIFSTSTREVVATIGTSGVFELQKQEGTDGGQVLLTGAFAENVKQLAASPRLKALLDAPLSAAPFPTSATLTRLPATAGKPVARPVGEATGAVVLVSLPDSFGSGVLISTDGYILTNEHVVGKARTVRLRWSDGFETTGEVIRTHKARDVALVKTDPRARMPLPVRTNPVQPGDTVVAIGAPLEKLLQGTITRGVVSANRIIDGYSFIQSDVNVNHGNSGGPLLDEKGAVVGLTDWGYAPDGTPVGLNFFIPIKDALDYLGLDLTPPAAAETPPAPKASASRVSGARTAR